MKRLLIFSLFLFMYILLTVQFNCSAQQLSINLSFTDPKDGQHLKVGEPFICKGKYQYSPAKTNPSGTYIWLFLMDVYQDGYYIQGPVIIKNNGTWEGTINPGTNITKVVAILANDKANATFKSWIKNHQFGKQNELPEGVKEVAFCNIKS